MTHPCKVKPMPTANKILVATIILMLLTTCGSPGPASVPIQSTAMPSPQVVTLTAPSSIAEGNLDLCEDRIEESEIDLTRLEAGLKRSYLYYIRRR